MKNRLFWKVWTGSLIFLVYFLMGTPTVDAMKKGHSGGKAPAAAESMKKSMMSGSESGRKMGSMMGDSGDDGEGMMKMMMAHMMGGPGGMGKMMKKMKTGMKGGGSDSPSMAQMTKMLEKLNLTPEQWQQVRGLARTVLERMVDLWAQRMKLKIQLASLDWNENIDAKKIKELFVKKAEAKADMLLACMEYLRGLKEILTPEQSKDLDVQGF